MKPRAVVTLGVFDGVHLGHQAVLGCLVRRARAEGARAVAFTFDPAPGAVLNATPEFPALTLLGERTALLRRGGANEVRVLRFTPALAAKSAERFVAEHLLTDYELAGLVVGYDFALGRGREGTVPVLRALGEGLGFPVEAVPAVEGEGGVVSSTRIREALEGGDVALAKQLLGRSFHLAGRVVPGDSRGRTLGFPTANLEVSPRKLRPGSGVYAVGVHGAGSSVRPGVVNLGRRPTFGGGEETVEVHLLDWVGDLAGQRLRLEFEARLRPERKFNSANELKNQIEADVSQARQVLSEVLPKSGVE